MTMTNELESAELRPIHVKGLESVEVYERPGEEGEEFCRGGDVGAEGGRGGVIALGEGEALVLEVLDGEGSPADADADDAAATASNSDNESSLYAESAGMAPERPTGKKRQKARAVEDRFTLAKDTCDLTSPFLLAGIHGTSVAQEAPAEEAPQTFSESDESVGAAIMQQTVDRLLLSG